MSLRLPLVLAETDWQARRARHEERVRPWTAGRIERQARGTRHPVDDFLFEYYSFRPGWLRRWHPGPDVVLLGAAAREFLRWPEYGEVSSAAGRAWTFRPSNAAEWSRGAPAPEDERNTARAPRPQRESGLEPAAGARAEPVEGVAVDCTRFDPRRRESLAWLRGMLRGVQERPPFFGCHGLHEWAMVYRLPADRVRHAAWPLRFPPEEVARIVEALPVCCSHFDAFRFFTPEARPLNRLQPERATTDRLEQRGCLHANMDLYKWAYKLAPFSPAELVADCFELARDIRAVDMRASPYDLRALGCAPIAIETPAGRAEYESHQRGFAARSEPLRARLLALCDRLLEPQAVEGEPEVAGVAGRPAGR